MRHSIYLDNTHHSNLQQRRWARVGAAARQVLMEAMESRQLLSVALDNSFHGDGKIETPNFTDAAVLGDNKIMGSFTNYPVSPRALQLYRYNANGSLDTTYGSGGVVSITVPFGVTTS